jgi:glycosyltransferase involved in cell wall biosynthesis
MVGEGPEFPTIEKEVTNGLLSDRVLVVKAVPHEDIPWLYRLVDLLLVPRPSTLATETAIPLKAIEALASGTLVVGTKVGGLHELLKMGILGLLLFEGPSEIAQFIVSIESRDHLYKIKQQVGSASLSQFSARLQALRLINVYKELLGLSIEVA